MATTDLAIQIATTLDATGINKANKQVASLDKRIKSLGRTLGLTLGATAMIAYGKAAVKAFAADEAAAKRLATAVDNLGLSFFKADVETFIGNLEKSASIADDVLRPAFQSLLTTTGSLTKSQELLNNAIQISRASGVALGTVVEDLNKGYVGVTRGLIKYNTGLTRAELQTKSFNEILGIVLAKSAGSAQAYLETTSFKLDALTLAGENAKETIGAGLVDAFARLGGGSSTADAVQAIDSIAKGINGITKAAGTAIGAVVKLYKGLDFLTSFGGLTGANGSLGEAYARLEARNDARGKSARSASPAGVFARTKQQRDAEAAAAKRAKELAKLTKQQVDAQKKLTAEQKKQNALKKAGSIFDLDQIQIIAALKGQLSEQDRKRLELQFALLLGNEEEASRLTYQLAKAQGLGEQIARDLASLPMANNPFASWEAYLDKIAEKARQIASLTVNAPLGTAAAAAASSGMVSTNVSTNVPVTGFTPPPTGTYGTPMGAVQGPQVIELKITGDGDLTNTIAKNLMQQSLSTGNQTYVNRRTGGFE
jgi:hypothetical protein